jgi:hypothetical protein
MLKDRYGNDLSTTSTAARDAYLAGVDSLMAATPGMDAAFAQSVAADDGFALGHISLARAKQLLGRGHEAKAPLARARELAAGTSKREQSQIAIFEKILTGQAPAALEAIQEHLKSWPRDAMALAPATSVFGLIGFSGKVGREIEQLAILEPFARHYGDDWWYLTQLAFAQIELGKFDHIRGHLFYELGERAAGRAFLRDWMKDYSREGLLHCHNSWHLAIWALETGDRAEAWRLYDEGVSPRGAWGPQVNVATDSPAFLLRAEMAGEPRKIEQWRELGDYAGKWFGKPGLSFVDAHTVLAYAMAGDNDKLATFADNPRGSAGDMMPAMARGFTAYANGDWKHAEAELEPLLDTHERLGGSRAQRDLFEYTVVAAKLKGGKAAEARETLARRRPNAGKSGSYPLQGL